MARSALLPVFLAWMTSMLLVLPAAAKPAGVPVADSSRAPAFTLPARQGMAASDSLRGKVVLVDFWASWCDPCRRSFPWMTNLYRQYAGKGFTIVAINLDKSRKAADAFLDKYPVPFTVAFDPEGKTAEAFKVAAMPSSYLIGPDGAILYRHAGFELKKTGPLEALVKEACSK